MMKMTRLFSALWGVILLIDAANANEHYLLPDNRSDLLHTMQQKIERAGSVTIITQELKEPALTRSIEKALRKGTRLHLITGDLESAAFFAKYRNTRVSVPASGRIGEKFALNILIIDKSDACFSGVAFSEAALGSNIGEVTCTTDQEDVGFAEEIGKRFTQRFEAYER